MFSTNLSATFNFSKKLVLLVTIGLLAACLPKDVVTISIEGLEEGAVYSELPDLVFDYSTSTQASIDNQLEAIVFTLNGVDITEYLSFGETSAVVSDEAAVTTHLNNGNNVLSINNPLVENNPLGNLLSFLNPYDNAEFEYSIAEPNIVVSSVVNNDGSLIVSGISDTVHPLTSIKVNGVDAVIDTSGEFDTFTIELAESDSYVITAENEAGLSSEKVYSARGAYIKNAIRVGVSDDLLANIDMVNEGLNNFSGTIAIPADITDELNPLVDLNLVLARVIANITENENEEAEITIDSGINVNSVNFVDSGTPSLAKIDANIDIFDLNIPLDLKLVSLFPLPIPVTEVDVQKANVLAEVGLAVSEDNILNAELLAITLDLEQSQVTIPIVSDIPIVDDIVDALVNAIVSVADSLLGGLITQRVNELLGRLLGDLVLGAVLDVPNVLESDIRIANFDSDNGNLYLDIQTAFHADKVVSPALGALATANTIPFNNPYPANDAEPTDTISVLALTTENFAAVDYMIDTQTQAPLANAQQNIKAVVAADVVNQLLLGLYESSVTTIDLPISIPTEMESVSIASVTAGLGAPIEIAFKGGPRNLTADVVVPSFALDLKLNEFLGGTNIDALNVNVLATVAADVSISESGELMLSIDPDRFDFTLVQTDVLGGFIPGIKELVNAVLVFIKPQLAIFLTEYAQNVKLIDLPQGVGLSNITLGLNGTDNIQAGFDVNVDQLLEGLQGEE